MQDLAEMRQEKDGRGQTDKLQIGGRTGLTMGKPKPWNVFAPERFEMNACAYFSTSAQAQ
jgi:hypothetical protein